MQPAEPADTSVLTALFQHNLWANLKLLEFCAALTDEQLDTGATGTYGSIRDTLWHLVGAEVSYVLRVNGHPPPAGMRRDVFPGLAVLTETARWSGDELQQLALSTQADSLVEERDEEQKLGVEYPLASLMLQVINHGTEHRTQVSTILTQLGLEPPNMDAWTYMEEKGQFREFSTAADA